MIKFFRKIRQNLLMENPPAGRAGKTGKYFKYALGEIILVVIGILIALSINNWNENRISNNQEKEVLEALKREFTENKKILSSTIKNHAKVLRLLTELNEQISPELDTINNQRLDSLMYGLGWLPQYSPKDGVINSLVTSGKISLIRNNELSSKLASWTSFINIYQTTYKWTENDVFEQVLPYVKNKYPFRRTLKLFDIKNTSNSKFQYSQIELLSDLGFESILANRIINAQDVLDAAQALGTFQAEVLNLIADELNK